NAHQLQLMAMNLGATYTLAKDIDLKAALGNSSEMWGSQGFASIGMPHTDGSIEPFFGEFNGGSHTISNLSISPTAVGPAFSGYIGLFGANTGWIHDVTLADVSVHGNPNAGASFQTIGALVGLNAGTISDAHVSGTVDLDVAGAGHVSAGGL